MDPTLMDDYFAMAMELRAAGARVEVNMNYQDTSNRAQMTIGLSRRAPALLFYGSKDAENGTVGVKNTATRTQESVRRADLVKTVLTILGRSA